MLGLASPVAWAFKESTVTRIEGAAYVLRCSMDSSMLATWAEQADGRYQLVIIDGDNGDKRTVTTKGNKAGLWKTPGGICWIPETNKLLFTYGIYNDLLDEYRVLYHIYDSKTKVSKKKVQLIDKSLAFTFDPIAAEDGSRLLHLLFGPDYIPQIVTYFSADQPIISREAVSQLGSLANISSEYDLGSDGSMVYWPLHNEQTGDYSIVGWDLSNWVYTESYTYGASKDPADGHALIKVDTRHMQSAALVESASDPTLKMCIYNFADPNNLYILPVNLQAEEEIHHFEWKGHANTLYLLVYNARTEKFSIREVDPLERKHRLLYETSDEISFVDYSSRTKVYYFSVVDTSNPSKPFTRIKRLR